VTEETFRTADVARVLGVSSRRVRAMVRAGWCRPDRTGRAYAFHFQDLVLLRTAHGLAEARVPARRLKRALKELLRQLPAGRPLSGVRIAADGGRVIVRDGESVWQPDSGQLLLDFSVDELVRATPTLRAVRAVRAETRSAPRPTATSAVEWFNHAVDLEESDPEAARAAYQRALELDPDLGDAYVNLGRLAHQAGDPTTAARCYHHALRRDDRDPETHYNLALALDDLDRHSEALAHYTRAVTLNPRFADAHYNLSQLLDRLGRNAEALQHMLRYRQLVRRR
jgi:tetratricopeptide (TPR) repeat protein